MTPSDSHAAFAVLQRTIEDGHYGEHLDIVDLCRRIGVNIIESDTWEHETYHQIAKHWSSRRRRDREHLHSFYCPTWRGSPTIFIHEYLSEEQKRFFIAHELYHHLDVREATRLWHYSEASKPVVERRADSFAFQLLVPETQFVSALAVTGVPELQRRFRMHPPDFCSILLTRAADGDLFAIPTLITSRGEIMTSPRVRIPKNCRDQLQVRRGKIVGPCFEIRPIRRGSRRVARRHEIWGGVIDNSGTLYTAVGWKHFLDSWAAQEGMKRREESAAGRDVVVGTSRHGYRVRAPKLGDVHCVREGTQFAEMHVSFVLGSGPATEPGVPYAICFGVRDDNGAILERWRSGKLTIEVTPRDATQTLVGYLRLYVS